MSRSIFLIVYLGFGVYVAWSVISPVLDLLSKLS
jgi:hypothetical protein